MPRIELIDPFGMTFRCDTRQAETLLRAWFDEHLPYMYLTGRPGIDSFETLWPKVLVWPMWATPMGGPPTDPDWLCDSRVLGRAYELHARNGDEGLAELLRIRRELEDDLKEMGVR
jgi:hypothetical protein